VWGEQINESSQNAIDPFAFFVENEARKRDVQVDLQLIYDVFQASGYID